jgi:PRTRC genetic system protein B
VRAQVRIGSSRELTLQSAVLVYSDGSGSFATLHEVAKEEGKAPYLRPGQALTTTFLHGLAEGLGVRMPVEILAENVLVRTAEMIVWWSTAARRVMFFGGGSPEAERLNGRIYPHPPLVFKIEGREMFVRALAGNRRPTAVTPLMTAPYWNCGSDGRVCLGSSRVPDEMSVDLIDQWQAGFFSSSFTHAGGAVRLTKHAGGFVGLWSSLAGSGKPFPVEYLTDARQTLKQFVDAGDHQ